MKQFRVSQHTEDKAAEFAKADLEFKVAWEKFEQDHATELENLDKLREKRNNLLDDAQRMVREESHEADIAEIKSVRVGAFVAQKRWQSFYIPKKLLALLEAKGMKELAISSKIISEKIEVEKYDVVRDFLEHCGWEGMVADFEECEDGIELAPAIFGPKPIPPFGAELKIKEKK